MTSISSDPIHGPTPVNISAVSRVASMATLTVTTAVAALVSIRWVVAIVAHRNVGLDVSDEGLYLSALEFPGQIPSGPSDFASYLRLLWLLSGRNIPLFRLVGLVCLVAICLLCGTMIARFSGPIHATHRRLLACSGACIIFAGASYQYALWIVTPNYNFLTQCMLLIAGVLVAGLVLSNAEFPSTAPRFSTLRHPLFWAYVVATSLAAVRVLAGLLVLLVLVGIQIIGTVRLKPLEPRERLRLAAYGVTSGVLLYLLLTRRSPLTSVQQWSDGTNLVSILQSHTPAAIWGLDFYRSDVRHWIPLGASWIALVGLSRFLLSNTTARRIVALVITIPVMWVLWSSHPIGGGAAAQFEAGWWWIRTVYFALLIGLLIPERLGKYSLVGPFLAVLGIVGATGSNNSFYRQIIFMLGILVMALFVQLVQHARTAGFRFLVTAPTCMALTMILAAGLSAPRDAQRDPYRLQGPLAINAERVDLGSLGVLSVSPPTADFLRWIQAFAPKLPTDVRCVVNLEGGTPILSVVLGIRPAGTNWDPGGYPGSDARAVEALQLDRCWESAPFVLVEASGGYRAISVPTFIREKCTAPPVAEGDMVINYPTRMTVRLCNTTVD